MKSTSHGEETFTIGDTFLSPGDNVRSTIVDIDNGGTILTIQLDNGKGEPVAFGEISASIFNFYDAVSSGRIRRVVTPNIEPFPLENSDLLSLLNGCALLLKWYGLHTSDHDERIRAANLYADIDAIIRKFP